MILQLFSLLNASSDKYVAFKIMALIGKKSPKSNEKLRRELYMLISKKLPKLNKKTRKKIKEIDQ